MQPILAGCVGAVAAAAALAALTACGRARYYASGGRHFCSLSTWLPQGRALKAADNKDSGLFARFCMLCGCAAEL